MTNTMPTVFAAGCIVVYRDTDGPRLLLIHDRHGAWTFPKGHLDAGESSAQAAIREVYEETGITGTLGALVASITYPVTKKGQEHLKQVDFFLMATDQLTVHLQAEEGIDDYRWVTPAEAQSLISYPQVNMVVQQALAHL
jgi:8-oxo-dGTP diphosphatase